MLKTRICFQRLVPIQPKASEILPKICQTLATRRSSPARRCPGGPFDPTAGSVRATRVGGLLVRGRAMGGRARPQTSARPPPASGEGRYYPEMIHRILIFNAPKGAPQEYGGE